MSSDDGYILRKNAAGKFVLQHYMGEEYPDVNAERAEKFNTIEEAMERYEFLNNSAYPSEYGLTVQIKQEENKMEPQNFARKPFAVKAIQVTATNLNEVAKWCSGEVKISDVPGQAGQAYVSVEVHNPLNERQTRAFVNDWVLFAGKGFKVYTDRAFQRSFVPEGGKPNGPDSNVFDDTHGGVVGAAASSNPGGTSKAE